MAFFRVGPRFEWDYQYRNGKVVAISMPPKSTSSTPGLGPTASGFGNGKKYITILWLFMLGGCAGSKPKPAYEFDSTRGKCLVYGRIVKGDGGGSYVIFERHSPHKEIRIKTWKLGGDKGYFLMELDSGSYVVRQAQLLRPAHGGSPMSVTPGLPVGEGKEDRSKNTQYFDKHIVLPANEIVYVGEFMTREYGLSIDFNKPSVDALFIKEYPKIDFKASKEIFPQ